MQKILPHLTLVLATIIWAAASVVIKLTLKEIPPFTFMLLRYILVCIVVLPYMWYTLKAHKISSKDYFNLFLLGLFSQAANAISFLAFKYTTVLDATVITVFGTVAAVYAGHYFYREKLNRWLKLGLILASLGTFVVVLEPIINQGFINIAVENRILGNLFGLLYALTWVIYIIWSKMSMGENSPTLKKALSFVHIKKMSTTYPPSLIVSVTFYVALAVMIPFALAENLGYFGAESIPNFQNITAMGIFGVVYMALFSAIVAYYLYQWGLEHAKVSDTALYGYLGPIFTAPIAFFVLNEMPNAYVLIGGLFIAIGVIIAEAHNT